MKCYPADLLLVLSDSLDRVYLIMLNAHTFIIKVSTALKLYLTLARGLLLQPGEGVAASKLCKSITFRSVPSLYYFRIKICLSILV